MSQDDYGDAIYSKRPRNVKPMDPYFQVQDEPDANEVWNDYLENFDAQGKFAPDEEEIVAEKPVVGDNGYVEEQYKTGADIMDITRGMF